MMAVRRTRDEQVLEAIFNPENPVTDLEVTGRTDYQFYTFEESVAQTLNYFMSYPSCSWVRWRMGRVKVGRWRRTLMQCRGQRTWRSKQYVQLRRGTWKMPWSC